MLWIDRDNKLITIDDLYDVKWSGLAKYYVDFLVKKGKSIYLEVQVLKCNLINPTDKQVSAWLEENILLICCDMGYRFNNESFKEFLTERGYRYE